MLYMWFYKQLFNFIEIFNIYFSPALTEKQNNTLPARFVTSFNTPLNNAPVYRCTPWVHCIIYHTIHFNRNISAPLYPSFSPQISLNQPHKSWTHPLFTAIDNKTGYIFLKFLLSQSQHCPFNTENILHYTDHVFFSLQPRIQNMSRILCIQCP